MHPKKPSSVYYKESWMTVNQIQADLTFVLKWYKSPRSLYIKVPNKSYIDVYAIDGSYRFTHSMDRGPVSLLCDMIESSCEW